MKTSPSICGPRLKPTPCLQCPLHGTSLGFVPDKWPENVKVGVLKYMPLSAEVEVQENCPEDKKAIWKELIRTSGLDLDDIGFSNILRCKMPPAKVNKNLLLKTSLICRQYDNQHSEGGRLAEGSSLFKWNPDVFIITFDLTAVVKAVAHKVFIRRAFEIAMWYAEVGYRPLVLMGVEAAHLIMPSLFDHSESYEREVTFKAWVGHHFVGTWPYGCKGEERLVNLHEESRFVR